MVSGKAGEKHDHARPEQDRRHDHGGTSMQLATFLKGIEEKPPTFLKEGNPVFVTDFYDPIADVKKELIGTTITGVHNDSFTAKKGKYLYDVTIEQHEYTEEEEEDMSEDEKCSFIISSVEIQKLKTPDMRSMIPF
jgi:hypothetical protein